MVKRLFGVLCWMLLLGLSGSVVLGQTRSTKSKTVLRLESKRKALEAEMNVVAGKLNNTGKSLKARLDHIVLLHTQIEQRKELIKTLQGEVVALESQIATLVGRIKELELEFEKKQKNYVKSLQSLQQNTTPQDQLLFILSAEDFQQGMRRIQYLKEYAQWQKAEGEKLKALHLELERQREQLRKDQESRHSLLETAEKEHKKLEADERRGKQEAESLRKEQRTLQQELNKKKRQANALNAQIEAQIRKEIEEAARKAKEEAAREQQKSGGKTTKPIRKAITKGGYAMTEKEAKLSGSFQSNKGKLPIPISGAYTITSYFGVQQMAGLKQVRVNNSGIDLRGNKNAEARVVFDGVVSRIFVMEGYNNNIIVRHGNYLTVYSNITTVYVRTGDKVSTGQPLGKIATDSELGGDTKLQFQIWRETTKLNPMHWLRR